MKKRLVLILMAAMLTLSVAACGKNNGANDTNETTGTETGMETNTETTPETETNTETTPATDADDNVVAGDATINSTVDVLNNVWTTFGENEQFFATGGDMANAVENAPGLYSMEDTEMLSFALHIPTDSVEMIDEAASLIHAMNANTFTAAAFHLTDSANADSLVTALKDDIMNTQWMCGFPDKLVIFTVNDEYVTYAFGNIDNIENFKTKMTAVYGENAVLVVEENII